MGCTESRQKGTNKERTFTDAPVDLSIVDPEKANISQKPTLEDVYQLSMELAQGNEKMLIKAGQHRYTGEIRVVRSYYNNVDKEAFKKEVAMQQLFDHPHILRFHQAFISNSQMNMVFDPHGKEIMGNPKQPEEIAAVMMRQLLSAVAYIHRLGICHRNITLDKFLQEEQDEINFKLTGFDKAHTINGMREAVGEPYITAPEVLCGYYNEAVDVWSCGVILHQLLSGMKPYDMWVYNDVPRVIQEKQLKFDEYEWKGVSTDAKELVLKMLEKDPARRITARDALKHPWIVRNNIISALPDIITEALTNLEQRTFKNRYHAGLWMLLVEEILPLEIRNQVMSVFEALDKDFDGQLSQDEMKEGLEKFCDDGDLSHAIKQFDLNGNGMIDFSEFVMATVAEDLVLTENGLAALWRMIVKPQMHTISLADCKELAEKSTRCRYFEEDWEKFKQDTLMYVSERLSTGNNMEFDWDAFKDYLTTNFFETDIAAPGLLRMGSFTIVDRKSASTIIE